MTVDQYELTQKVKQAIELLLDIKAQLSQEPQPTQPTTTPKTEPTKLHSELNFNPDICAWMPAKGHRGEYEVAKDGTNYRFLKKYLEEHEGKATINGMFYWLFTDKISIGRKPSKTTITNGGN